jgi:hypothetical protein
MTPSTGERKGVERKTFTIALTPDERQVIGQRTAEASYRAGRPISMGKYIIARALAPLDESEPRKAA